MEKIIKGKKVVGAWALIVHQKNIVLVLNDWTDQVYGPCWGAPGGSQELGETLEQTVVREVCEETGLRIRVAGICFLIEYDGYVAPYFSAHLVGPDTLKPGKELIEVKFVAVDEIHGFAAGKLIARRPIEDFLTSGMASRSYYFFDKALDLIN